ncbi:MAG: ABC transporter ATP-binding protein/permease [Clostridia bacterium]|nr:ABC transporter ATP-binding protein/permease [Clostridia bacterium]
MSNRKIRLLWELTRGNMRRFVGAVFAVVVAAVISLVTPLVLEETIDAVIGNLRPVNLPGFLSSLIAERGGREYLVRNLWIMALILVVLSLINGVFQYLRGKWTAQASNAVSKNMRDKLYAHIQMLPYDYHVKAATGDLIQRCTSDVETIFRFLSVQLVEIFRAVFMIAAALTVMLQKNPLMTAVTMVSVPILFFFALLFFRWVRKLFRVSDEAEGRMSAILQENLTGVRVVRAFGRQAYEVEKFSLANDDLRNKSLKLVNILSIYWASADLISMAQTATTLVFGVFLAVSGKMTVGELTVFVSYTNMLMWPVRQLGRILSDMGKSLVSLERVDEVLREPAEAEEEGGSLPLNGDIEFKNVGFEYERQNPVLKDVSFKVKAGQTVAILGATGAGKSTLMHLLQRLYEVKRGEITIGGRNIKDIPKKELRRHIGLILQEPFLYARTVGQNIAFAGAEADEDAVRAAAVTASADAFIQGFDKKYDTLVGERGVTLSGGQKQRVAIARTLLKENDILIFDDSLSAVDTQTDKAIRDALAKLQNITTFIISHRLTTLSEADMIVVLEDGRVSQQGTHDELIHIEGLYRKVYQIQSALEAELSGEVTN